MVLLTGLDSLGNSYNDMWRINPTTLVWQQLASIPGLSRKGGMCFNSNTTIYYTTGIDQTNTRLKETWKVFNPTGIEERNSTAKINCFPNPVIKEITFEFEISEKQDFTIEIKNALGQTVKTIDNRLLSIGKNKIEIDVSEFSKGLYFLQLQSENNIISKKFIKE